MMSYPVVSLGDGTYKLLANLDLICFFSLFYQDSLVAEDLSQMGRDTIASLIAGIIQRNSLTSEVGCSVNTNLRIYAYTSPFLLSAQAQNQTSICGFRN